MKYSTHEEEPSLAVRIYLYMICLFCLSAGLWIAHDLDQQRAKKLSQQKQVQNDIRENGSTTTQVTIIPARASQHNAVKSGSLRLYYPGFGL